LINIFKPFQCNNLRWSAPAPRKSFSRNDLRKLKKHLDAPPRLWYSIRMIKQVIINYPGEGCVANLHLNTNDVDDVILERMFGEWNGGSGMESATFERSKKRSMCVGDFIYIQDGDGLRVWQCESFGWGERSVEDYILFDRRVKNHPKFSHGAWFAMNEVLWEDKLDT